MRTRLAESMSIDTIWTYGPMRFVSRKCRDHDQAGCDKESRGAFYDRLDDVWRRYQAKFLVKAGDRIPVNHRVCVSENGRWYWRSLPFSEMKDAG